MRKRISSRRVRLHVAFAAAFVVSIALGMSGACAQAAKDDDDEEAFDVKIFRGFMKELGLQRDEAPIEYRERSPLVVPPSRNALPPPRDEASINNPAWPKDPDVKRRQEATVTPAAKARIRGDRVMDDNRPMRPDEYAVPPSAPRTGGSNNTAETSNVPVKPSELGSTKGLWEMMFSGLGPDKPEYAPFPGESARNELTAPPSGYQTPSPAQPYGVTPSKGGAKPLNPDDRLLPSR